MWSDSLVAGGSETVAFLPGTIQGRLRYFLLVEKNVRSNHLLKDDKGIIRVLMSVNIWPPIAENESSLCACTCTITFISSRKNICVGELRNTAVRTAKCPMQKVLNYLIVDSMLFLLQHAIAWRRPLMRSYPSNRYRWASPFGSGFISSRAPTETFRLGHYKWT